jgi:hypothetical protein
LHEIKLFLESTYEHTHTLEACQVLGGVPHRSIADSGVCNVPFAILAPTTVAPPGRVVDRFT